MEFYWDIELKYQNCKTTKVAIIIIIIIIYCYYYTSPSDSSTRAEII